ncbi:armadillo repeat-containing protein 4 isoform X2 [Lingula anatina]|uniref:Armadillo repeat-containing protein 4 isoform X2 n=1 Tax=Lingula anatina TaxID=7574 RepID=A0A1S3J495_LINAN|nr:armadillo repeat-containing protein 4 isoform X2 [Lingula anatina]|eukprot:XP_013405098.1 armadillo repeat-containing protein 4 isoform X2 [Lingula anatina]
MGQALRKAKEGTSAAGGARGKLEYNAANEELLNSVVKYVENIKDPEEQKLIFKKPIKWESSLQPSDFNDDAYEKSGVELVSKERTADDQPLLRVRPRGEKYEVSAMTIEQIQMVLRMAGDKKLAETRACCEATDDPYSDMLGDAFAIVPGNVEGGEYDKSRYRLMEEIMKGGPEEEVAEKKTTLKLLDHLFRFDNELLNRRLQIMEKTIRLNPSEVEDDVHKLMKYCGEDDEKCLLEELNFMPEFSTRFSNGCRAPPWRQVHGDICYLEAKAHDVDPYIYITGSTSGYYINGGVDKETQSLNFDKQGEMHKDLISLLKEKSPKFAEIVDKLEFVSHHDLKESGIIDTTADLDATPRDGEMTNREQTQVKSQQQKEETKQEKTQKTQKKQQQKLEPSLKWRNLGLEEQKEQHEKKDKPEKSRTPIKRKTQQRRNKTPLDAEDSFSESSTESEEEEETPDRRNEPNSDLPSEYWQIQKLVKYLKGGNQTATIIALCAMRDFNLTQETCQLAIRDVGGLEVLINLLDTEDIKCKIGSLKILKEISGNSQIRRAIADLGGLQTMVNILQDPNKELKCLAAGTIANVAKFRRARRTVRQHGGIKRLVGLLDCAPLGTVMSSQQEEDVEVARCGALALWSCSKSTKNKQAMRKAGVIPLLAQLLKSPHENMCIPVVGTLQECASEPSYRLAIRTEGMVEDLVKNLNSENQELQMHCASAIFKCAEDKETRDLVRQYGGLDPLVKLLQSTENKELLAAATGAIWKCAISDENVLRFQELKTTDYLVALLNDQPEEVLVNVVGALGECAKDPPNRMAIRKAGGIPPLVNLLTGTNQKLLVNVTKAVGQCAEESDNMAIIDKLDGVRLLWSLLKNPNPEVQASAAWAICPCIENAKDAGEMVRSFVGGLELIVSLLKSEDKEVLASVCAAIANIAKDEENLAVITDHGVVPMLAKLTETVDDRLRQHLAEAIARCCSWGNNRVAFGTANAVAPLVKYLKSKQVAVHRSTAKALFQLSKDPDNCITMHNAGVVKPLMNLVGSADELLQEAAAGCIGNIRRLALANEKARNS